MSKIGSTLCISFATKLLSSLSISFALRCRSDSKTTAPSRFVFDLCLENFQDQNDSIFLFVGEKLLDRIVVFLKHAVAHRKP